MTDWVGLWFELLRHRGFDTKLRIGRIDPATQKVTEWHDLDHSEVDGVGALAVLFRQRGLNPGLPLLAPSLRGGLFVRLKGLISYFRFMPVHGALWKQNIRGRDNSCAYRCATKVQTEEILAAAKEQRVSVNSLLLWALAETVKPRLLAGSGPHLWMIPVNMRGGVRKAPDTSNHLSCVWADTTSAASPLDVQNALEKQFKSGIHWGNWLVLNVGRWIGVRGMNRLLDRVERIGDRTVGTFSNLGVWEGGTHSWVGFVPVTASSPLGAVVGTFNDRMSFCLQASSELGLAQEQLDEVIHEWISRSVRRPHFSPTVLASL